jgi:hypothetical protein
VLLSEFEAQLRILNVLLASQRQYFPGIIEQALTLEALSQSEDFCRLGFLPPQDICGLALQFLRSQARVCGR